MILDDDVLGVDHGDDLIAVQRAGDGIAGGGLAGVALDGQGGLLGHIIGGALLRAGGGIGGGQDVAVLIHIVDGDGIVMILDDDVLGVDHGDDLIAVQRAGDGIAGGGLEGVALDGQGGLLGHVIGGALPHAVRGVGRGHGVALFIHIADGDGVVVVLGVDHGDDLVAVQGAGEGVAGGGLIGVALDGDGILGGHVIGGAFLHAGGGIGGGYGVAVLVHIVNGDGVVVDLIGDGGLQEILTLARLLGTGSHGVEGSAAIGVETGIALAAIGVIGAVGAGFRLGVHQLHGVVQLHAAEVGDGLVNVPTEVLLAVCGGGIG